MIIEKTNNPYGGFADAFLRAVLRAEKEKTEDRIEEKPFVDARPETRTCANPFQVKELTAEDFVKAVEAMQTMPKIREVSPFQAWGYYIFMTEWVTPFVTEADCIRHYADNGSVLVYDSQGKFLRCGEQVTTKDLFEIKKRGYPVGMEVLR